MEVILKNVRMAYANIYAPRAMANDPSSKPAYGARLVIVPGSENDKVIQAALEKVAADKWQTKGPQILKQLKADKKVCYTEAEYTDKNGDVNPGFEGSYSLATRSEKLKPTVKNRFNADVAEGESGAPYSGCYVHAAVDVWPQDNQFGRRINATLQGVMFAADGESFGGGRPAGESTFAGLAAEPVAEDFV